jgi:hypothetical protein
LHKLAGFVVSENSSHHRSVPCYEENFLKEVESVYAEDLLLYDTSTFYVSKFNKKIMGSVKTTLWDELTVLPIEKRFNIPCKELSFFNDDLLIWHIGGLAISKSNNPYGLKLLMQLLILAIYGICRHPNSIMVAEFDKKLLRWLNRMGIKTEALA